MILSNLGKLSAGLIGQWLSEKEPRSRSLGSAPLPQPAASKSSKVGLAINRCANSAEIRNTALSHHHLLVSRHSLQNTDEHLHYPSVLASQVHHRLSSMLQIDSIIITSSASAWELPDSLRQRWCSNQQQADGGIRTAQR